MIFKKIIQTLFYSKKIEIQLNYSLEEFIKRLSSLPDNKYVILHSEETNDVLSFKIQKKLFLERDFFNPIGGQMGTYIFCQLFSIFHDLATIRVRPHLSKGPVGDVHFLSTFP